MADQIVIAQPSCGGGAVRQTEVSWSMLILRQPASSPINGNIGTPTQRVSRRLKRTARQGLNVEPFRGCSYRLGAICSDAGGAARIMTKWPLQDDQLRSRLLLLMGRTKACGLSSAVDASQGSVNALLWALEEARARKIPVRAVLA
jgi:hypothetical protein